MKPAAETLLQRSAPARLRDALPRRYPAQPTGRRFGTDGDSLPNRLPEPDYEVGVIAGNAVVNPIGAAFIPGENDGSVSVRSARLADMTDFLVVPHSHTFIMRSKDVAEQVIAFLRHGRFRRDAGDTLP